MVQSMSILPQHEHEAENWDAVQAALAIYDFIG